MSVWSRTLQRAEIAAEVDWDGVYAEQLPRVYNFFRYRVGNSAIAEDLTAATFEKAWSGRARYRQDLGAFSTWLFTIAHHVAVDYFRQRRDDAPLDDILAYDDGSSPHDTVQQRSDVARLRVLLAGLSERERELVALKYGAELTNREIARLTGLSESNVGTLLHRITLRLRAAWENG